jgi:predicted AlkP superfamily pyrophosphatase or phosphodiesterase
MAPNTLYPIQTTKQPGPSMTNSSAVLILIDGVRPDALSAVDCPHIDALCARGAWTLQATSLIPSITLPCITSILHSLPPQDHSVLTNDWVELAHPVLGLIDLAHEAGLFTASFYNWEPLRDLSQPGSLSLSIFRANSHDPEGDQILAEEAARLIRIEEDSFSFVYFGTVDAAGHTYGWMSDEYLAQVTRVDRALGTLLSALPADTTVLVQADHGGHGFVHGTEAPEDMLIPWIIAGPNIRRGYEIQGPVSLLDTAPTLARALGIAPHPEWEGRPVEEIYDRTGSDTD